MDGERSTLPLVECVARREAGAFPCSRHCSSGSQRVKNVRPFAAAAVPHTGRVEETDRIVNGFLANRLDDAVVVHQRRTRRDIRIGPSLVNQKLAAARGERLEIRIGRAERGVIELVNAVVVFREIERLRIPCGILQEDVLEDVVADVERLAAAGDRGPLQLAARLESWKNQLARLRVFRTRVSLRAAWTCGVVRQVSLFVPALHSITFGSN